MLGPQYRPTAVGRPPRRYVFRPKAQFTASPPQDGFAVVNLGHRPRISCHAKALALKARLIFGTRSGLAPDCESRFQRWAYPITRFLGRCPRLIWDSAFGAKQIPAA